MKSQELNLVVHIESLPDKVEELKSVLLSGVEKTVKEEGCIQYELCAEIETTTKFTMIEKWKDKASWEAHMQAPHVQEGPAKLEGLLAGPPELKILTPVS